MVNKPPIYVEFHVFWAKIRCFVCLSFFQTLCIIVLLTQTYILLHTQTEPFIRLRLRSVHHLIDPPFDSLYLPQYRIFSFLGQTYFPSSGGLRHLIPNISGLRNNEDITVADIEDELSLLTSMNLLHSTALSSPRLAVQYNSTNRSTGTLLTRSLPLLRPMGIVESGGGITQSGFSAEAERVSWFGTELPVSFRSGIYYRTEHAIGWQGDIDAQWFLGGQTAWFAQTSFMAHRFRTISTIGIGTSLTAIPRTSRIGTMDLRYTFDNGVQFIRTNDDITPYDYARRTFSANGSVRGSYRGSEFFLTGSVYRNTTDHLPAEYFSIADNTQSVMIGVQSISPQYESAHESTNTGTEYMLTPHPLILSMSGWFGHISNSRTDTQNQVDNMLYVGSMMSCLYRKESLYGEWFAYGMMALGSGFRFPVTAQYTAWTADMRLLFTTHQWRTTLRYTHMITGQWARFRQMILDNEAGLRGFSANGFAGDDRLLFSADIETPRVAGTSVVGLSLAVFADAGAVSRSTGRPLSLRFTGTEHLSGVVGMGLRLRYPSLLGGESVIRIDIPYHTRDRQFTQIVLSLSEAIPFLTRLRYTVPNIIGSGIDVE